ncbi:MAG: carbohydrate-binding family 9-like protein [Paludibacteraceae bacterium]
MKKVYVPYIDALNEINVENAGDILEDSGTGATIDVLNWKDEFPYHPITYFFIARSNKAIFIKYNVNGTMLKAVYSEDHSPVHEDSCVEFFCMPENADTYTNFEFNCIGTCSASRRKGRSEEVVPFSKESMKTIERYSSIGKKPFKEMEGMFEWDLTVKIPFDLMNLNPNQLPERIKGNFYKCADDTDSVHFVSWSPINTANPDFHRPEFFGELYFKEI